MTSPFQAPKPPTVFRHLFVAPDKVGKTHAAMTWPKPAFIDTEDRTKHFVRENGDFVVAPFSVAHAQTFADINAIVDRVSPQDCETLVVDSISRPHYRAMEAMSEPNEKLGTIEVKAHAWPKLKLTERACISKLCAKPMNIIATAYPRDIRAKAGEDINGYKVGTRDVVIKDVSLDFDDKVRHDFDFGWMLSKSKDGKRTDARCIFSSREDLIPRGRVIENFSYQTFMAALGIKPKNGKRADSDEPCTDVERGEIEKLAAEHGVGSSAIATICKQVTGNAVLAEVKTKGEARAIASAILHEAKARQNGATTPPQQAAQPAASDNEPITPEQAERIELLQLQLHYDAKTLGDVILAITKRTLLPKNCSVAEAQRVIAALEEKMSVRT